MIDLILVKDVANNESVPVDLISVDKCVDECVFTVKFSMIMSLFGLTPSDFG